jgi:tripartite-type tricarboxylate transporter receptor subunit TctC
MIPTLLRHLAATASLLALVAATPVAAQDYPSRPIRFVTWSSPGGNIDVLTRLVGEQVSKRFGQPVIVENRVGASGAIAAEHVARAAPDGYTVLFTTNTTHISNPLITPKLPYDPIRDFEPLGELVAGQMALVAAANAPYSTVREFVEWARRQPRGASYGSWGVGGGGHLLGEQLRRQGGIELTHVPYKGGELAAMSDLVGGSIEVSFMAQGNAKIQSQAGRIKVLGISGTRRNIGLPQVPTFAEQGFKGFEITGWIAAYAPAGTPAPIIDRLSTAMRESLRVPEVASRLEGLGFDPVGSTPEQFRRSFDADFKLWSELIRNAGLQAQ